MSSYVSLDAIIKRTVDANLSYAKEKGYEAKLQEVLPPIITVCFQDPDPERTKMLEQALDHIDELLVRESPLISWVYYLMSDARRREGQLQSAVDFAMESLRIREQIYGDNSNEVCICLDHLSSLFYDIPDYSKACRFLLQSVEIKLKMGYSLLPQLCRECVEFAANLKELKEYDVAMEMLLKAKEFIFEVPSSVSSSNSTSSNPTPSSSSSSSSQQGDGEIGKQERDGVKLQILFEMGSIFEVQGYTDKLLNVYEQLLEVYTSSSNPDTVKDVITTYDYLLSTYLSLENYAVIRGRLGQLITYVTCVVGASSLDTAVALYSVARILAELADTSSNTRLCDLADSVRYYTTILKICQGHSHQEQQKMEAALPVKEIRTTLDNLLYNNRPMRREEVGPLIEKLLTTYTVEYLLDTSKSQNTYLKIVYPAFMAEDALREKKNTIPSKSGFLAKYGVLKNWRTRFFVVERDVLYYYENHNDPKPTGEYNLMEVKTLDVLPPEKKYRPHTHCFSLVGPKRNILLAAENAEVMNDWVRTLNKAKSYWEEWNISPL
eukprot:TRINITY_DN6551_c0_g1_i1.p1 TRINITY_DN6551_c0_g1~~TRINITY_DN6551_c0_g1_i1.p1  ORF type:complete len:550 (+),score=152.99 TRINITY_DN6551_c0_g1_i1:49-1698(+)